MGCLGRLRRCCCLRCIEGPWRPRKRELGGSVGDLGERFRRPVFFMILPPYALEYCWSSIVMVLGFKLDFWFSAFEFLD